MVEFLLLFASWGLDFVVHWGDLSEDLVRADPLKFELVRLHEEYRTST